MSRIIYFFSECFLLLFLKVMKLFRIILSEEKINNIRQFIKFGIVGVSNTLLSYFIYAFLLLLFQQLNILESVDYLVSSIISWIISVFWSFIWNKKCVFDDTGRSRNAFWSSLIKAYCSYAFTGLLLSNLLLYVEVEKLKINKYIAPFIVLIVSIPINFILNKFWTFRKNKPDVKEEGIHGKDREKNINIDTDL